MASAFEADVTVRADAGAPPADCASEFDRRLRQSAQETTAPRQMLAIFDRKGQLEIMCVAVAPNSSTPEHRLRKKPAQASGISFSKAAIGMPLAKPSTRKSSRVRMPTTVAMPA